MNIPIDILLTAGKNKRIDSSFNFFHQGFPVNNSNKKASVWEAFLLYLVIF